MIVYSIEIFDELSEQLVREIEIPETNVDSVAEIMKWNATDKMSFIRGIGGFNVTKTQALELESLLGIKFYAEQKIIQISGGEI